MGLPQTIKQVDYAPNVAPTGPIREAADFRLRFPDGRMGSAPGQATPAIGRELVELAAASLLADVARFGGEITPTVSPKASAPTLVRRTG